MVSRKKDTYWHTLAKGLLAMGLKPASIAKCIKEVFPLSEVTGRHVGAYNRRLKTEGIIADHPTKPTCLLYTSPSPRDRTRSRMPSSA